MLFYSLLLWRLSTPLSLLLIIVDLVHNGMRAISIIYSRKRYHLYTALRFDYLITRAEMGQIVSMGKEIQSLSKAMEKGTKGQRALELVASAIKLGIPDGAGKDWRCLPGQ